MITLYQGSGASDFEILGDALDEEEHEALMLNARQMLRVRGDDTAVEYLERIPFRLSGGTNYFNDEFDLLVAWVPLAEYERIRNAANQPEVKRAFRHIATVLGEIGQHVRFIAVGLKRLSPESWDVFICHASEDKEDIVEPLYRHLDSVGIRCWYDRGEILWGDSIVGRINEGLGSSRFVIVVISPALLRKTWPTKEMNAAMSREIDSGTTRVLPLMVGSDQEVGEMMAQLALQRDKRYVRWSGRPQEIEGELRALLLREDAKEKP